MEFLISGNCLEKYLGTDEIVSVPEGIEIIGTAAFASCLFLRKVIFPSTLKRIDNLAFYNCKNLEIDIPKIYSIAEDAFLKCPNVMNDYILKEMSIEQIEKDRINTFYIPSYQRGYRWSSNEILELLEDIKTTENKYCMQPLVVKRSRNVKIKGLLDINGIKEVNAERTIVYELVDGQQRLTTLYLILQECYKKDKSIMPIAYSINYELKRGIDNDFVTDAIKMIDEWLEENVNVIKDFTNIIREKLYFIWYEMRDVNNTAMELEFKNINAGQTPLTNAELFKAMLLNPENSKCDIKDDILMIAFEWEKLEHNLRDNNFWLFIANNSFEEKTHLDYFFELYALNLENVLSGQRKSKSFREKLSILDKNRDRYSFLAIKEYVLYLKEVNADVDLFKTIKKVWWEIVNQYYKLYSWYNDKEIYHTLGYLITIENKNRGFSIVSDIVVEVFKNGKDKTLPEVRKFVLDKIKDILNKQVKYENKTILDSSIIFADNYYEKISSNDIKKILLLINVWSSYKSSERFLFYKYKEKNWDVEHISARNLKEDITEEDLKKVDINWWLEEAKDLIKDGNVLDLNKENWKLFAKRVKEEWADDSLKNLVLLESNKNRSYGNDLFFGKREKIIEWDKNSEYIPICTKNAFLKYYTKDPKYSLAWTDDDKNYYFKHVLECIADIYARYNVEDNHE